MPQVYGFAFAFIGDCIIVKEPPITDEKEISIEAVNNVIKELKPWLYAPCGLLTSYVIGCLTPNAIYIFGGEDRLCADCVTKDMLRSLTHAHQCRYDDDFSSEFEFTHDGEAVNIYNGIKPTEESHRPILYFDPTLKEWTLYGR